MGDREAAASSSAKSGCTLRRTVLAGGRIAHMADGREALEALDGGAVGEAVADEAELASREWKTRAVEGDDAGRLLAAMLQGVQAERRDAPRRPDGRRCRRRRIPRAACRRRGQGRPSRDRPATSRIAATSDTLFRAPGAQTLCRKPFGRPPSAGASCAGQLRRGGAGTLRGSTSVGGSAGSASGRGGLICFSRPSGLSGSMAMRALPVFSSIGRVFAAVAHSGILPCTSQARNTQPITQSSSPRAAPKTKPRVRSRAPMRESRMSVGDLHRDDRDDDQRDDEDAADRRGEAHRVARDVRPQMRQEERVQEPGGGGRRDPGDDGQDLAGEAAHGGQKGGDEDDAEDDEVEDREGKAGHGRRCGLSAMMRGVRRGVCIPSRGGRVTLRGAAAPVFPVDALPRCRPRGRRCDRRRRRRGAAARPSRRASPGPRRP